MLVGVNAEQTARHGREATFVRNMYVCICTSDILVHIKEAPQKQEIFHE